MKYAVIKTQGRQYKVAEGDEILVDKVTGDIKIETLMFVNEDEVKLGKPIIEKAVIKAKVIEELKGDKLYVQKYKAKSRYRKKIGFRPVFTKIKIEKISLSI